MDASNIRSWEEHRRLVRHELRTPINHILSYAELVREDAEDGALPGVVAEMQAVEAAGRSALKLVNVYLEAHQAPGEPTHDPAQTELAALMREVSRRVGELRLTDEVRAAHAIDADLQRIGTAAERLLALVEGG